MEGVVEVVIENEVKIILDEHDDRLKRLEIESAKNNEILKNLKEGQDKLEEKVDTGMSRLENIMLNNNNTVLSTMQQLIITKENNETQKLINKTDNDTNVKISKYNNYAKIIVGLFTLAATIMGSIWCASKAIQ